jgi:hypothetical protein
VQVEKIIHYSHVSTLPWMEQNVARCVERMDFKIRKILGDNNGM